MQLTKAKAFLLSLAVALCAFVAPAWADDTTQILDYRPTENPVADRTVHINVNKLDKDTHEYVAGSKLQIIDKETGDVVMEWTSGEDAYESERDLDVDRTYILHEVSAPEGYEVADDVEFILRSVNFETKGEVLSGAETEDGETNAEFNNVSGDIETQAFVISLYDAETPAYREERETRQRTANTETTTTKATSTKESGSDRKGTEENLTTTSDDTSYTPMIIVAVLGLIILAIALISRHRK